MACQTWTVGPKMTRTNITITVETRRRLDALGAARREINVSAVCEAALIAAIDAIESPGGATDHAAEAVELRAKLRAIAELAAED